MDASIDLDNVPANSKVLIVGGTRINRCDLANRVAVGMTNKQGHNNTIRYVTYSKSFLYYQREETVYGEYPSHTRFIPNRDHMLNSVSDLLVVAPTPNRCPCVVLDDVLSDDRVHYIPPSVVAGQVDSHEWQVTSNFTTVMVQGGGPGLVITVNQVEDLVPAIFPYFDLIIVAKLVTKLVDGRDNSNMYNQLPAWCTFPDSIINSTLFEYQVKRLLKDQVLIIKLFHPIGYCICYIDGPTGGSSSSSSIISTDVIKQAVLSGQLTLSVTI